MRAQSEISRDDFALKSVAQTVGAITVIVTVFSAGTVFGGTKAGQTVLSWFWPPPAITTAAPTPPTVKK